MNTQQDELDFQWNKTQKLEFVFWSRVNLKQSSYLYQQRPLVLEMLKVCNGCKHVVLMHKKHQNSNSF